MGVGSIDVIATPFDAGEVILEIEDLSEGEGERLSRALPRSSFTLEEARYLRDEIAGAIERAERLPIS
jgi:hypothetical protein